MLYNAIVAHETHQREPLSSESTSHSKGGLFTHRKRGLFQVREEKPPINTHRSDRRALGTTKKMPFECTQLRRTQAKHILTMKVQYSHACIYTSNFYHS